MADILNRFLLDTKDFDAKLSNSKRGVNDYQSSITNMAKTAGAGMLKFAGAIGLAYGGLETFNKVIHSSQGLGDSFDNTVNACKGTVDIFFQSLSNGDFSVFRNGILSTIKDMERLSALKDSLSDAKLSMGYNTKVFDSKFTEYESIIRDTTKSKEERNAALQALKKLKDSFKTDINDTLSGSIETLVKEFNTKSGRNDFTVADIEKYISINNNDFSTRNEKKALVEYQAKLKELQKQQYTNQIVGGGVAAGSSARIENKAITKQIEELKAANKELEKQNWLNNDNDVSRKEMIQNLEYIQDLKKRGYDFDKRTLELQNSLASNGNGSGSKTQTPVVGSIAEIDAKLAAKNKELINATTTQARIAVQTTINELEAKKINLQIATDKGVFAAGHGENKLGNASSSEMAGVINGGTKNTPGSQSLNLNSFEKIDIKLPIEKKDIDLNKQYAQSLDAISGSFGVMGNMANQFGNDALSFAANSIGSIAQMIIQLESLAAANGVASAMSLPFPANLAAIATVIATVTSVFSSLPKFANGGVFTGGSTFGDMNLARVNSGEMILNPMQQGNLFRLLDGGGSSGVGNITIGFGKIRGSDIFLSLKNYMKSTGKKL